MYWECPHIAQGTVNNGYAQDSAPSRGAQQNVFALPMKVSMRVFVYLAVIVTFLMAVEPPERTYSGFDDGSSAEIPTRFLGNVNRGG